MIFPRFAWANFGQVTLGEILLPRDDGFEFNPFEWAQVSAQAHSQTLRKLVDLKSRVSSEQDTIAKLNAQLDDFIKTKTETETAMLQQFMELLNEKKRKIRDQSRLLATAKVDKSAGRYKMPFIRMCTMSNAGNYSNHHQIHKGGNQASKGWSIACIQAESTRESSRT